MKSLKPRAFSLLELLAVIAIASLVIGFGVAGLSGAMTASRISSSANLLLQAARQARQNSCSKAVLTAFVVTRGLSATGEPQAYILLEKSAESEVWRPVTPWVSLSTGVVIDPVESASFFDNVPLVSILDLPPRAGADVALQDCTYQVFLPGGRLSVIGVTSPVAPVLHVTLANSNQSNVCMVSLNPLTGIATLSRP